MPIKKIISKIVDPQSALKTAPRGKRVEGVREIILSLLKKGPLSRSEIVKQGKFSEGSLYNNLKVLRDEGLIVSDKGSKKLHLAGTAAMPLSTAPAQKGSAAQKAATKKVSAKKYAAKKQSAANNSTLVRADRELDKALEAVLVQLTPIERAGEKMRVLEQLAQITPAPIAEILKLLAADVVRLSALKG